MVMAKSVDGSLYSLVHAVVFIYTGCPQKVRHYQESSLNPITNILLRTITESRLFINFEYKMSTRILYVVLNILRVI